MCPNSPGNQNSTWKRNFFLILKLTKFSINHSHTDRNWNSHSFFLPSSYFIQWLERNYKTTLRAKMKKAPSKWIWM